MPSSGAAGPRDDLDVSPNNGAPSAFCVHRQCPSGSTVGCRGFRPYLWRLCGGPASFFSCGETRCLRSSGFPCGCLLGFGYRGCECDHGTPSSLSKEYLPFKTPARISSVSLSTVRLNHLLRCHRTGELEIVPSLFGDDEDR